MNPWLIGGLWLVALVLAPFVARALRKARLRLDDAPNGEPRSFTDHSGSTWDERPDHLFDMRGTETGLYQGWTHSQIDRVHGPLEPAPRPEQDPTT